MDALVELLMNQYGLSRLEAEAYSREINAGKVTGGRAMQEGALQNVADEEIYRMGNLTRFPTVATRVLTDPNYQENVAPEDINMVQGALTSSKEKTQKEGKAALEKWQLEAVELMAPKKNSPEKQAEVDSRVKSMYQGRAENMAKDKEAAAPSSVEQRMIALRQARLEAARQAALQNPNDIVGITR